MSFDAAHFHARIEKWKRILRIGLPAGGEFALMSVFIGTNYFIIRSYTLPSLFSSASRLVTFLAPALWLASRPTFQLHQLWYLSVVTVFLQMITSWWLMRREFARKLSKSPLAPIAAAA